MDEPYEQSPYKKLRRRRKKSPFLSHPRILNLEVERRERESLFWGVFLH